MFCEFFRPRSKILILNSFKGLFVMRQTRLVNKDLHPCVESALLCRAIYPVIHSTTQITTRKVERGLQLTTLGTNH